MIIGDGSVQGNSVVYYTSSERLRDSFQELCVKLDYDSTVCARKNKIRTTEIRGHCISNACENYEISVRKSRNKKILPQKHVSREFYSGYVYCATVPNHTMYVRRNGKTSWCGTSGTTAVVSYQNHREYAGIERDPTYHKLALENIRNTTSKHELFAAPPRFKQNRLTFSKEGE
jgi:hypothetical protein